MFYSTQFYDSYSSLNFVASKNYPLAMLKVDRVTYG
jgi:hypothetical protein